MVINDYGRTVFNLIQHCKTIDDRNLRTKAAHNIVRIMAQVNPQAKDGHDYERKLWDHLMIMSNWELDVDCPYKLERRETVHFKPNVMKRERNRIRMRHYGRNMQNAIEKISLMEESTEKELLTAQIISHMRRNYNNWNNGSTPDNPGNRDNDLIVARQLIELSGGKMRVDGFQLPVDMSIIPQRPNAQNAKKKKKKKKKRPAFQQQS